MARKTPWLRRRWKQHFIAILNRNLVLTGHSSSPKQKKSTTVTPCDTNSPAGDIEPILGETPLSQITGANFNAALANVAAPWQQQQSWSQNDILTHSFCVSHYMVALNITFRETIFYGR